MNIIVDESGNVNYFFCTVLLIYSFMIKRSTYTFVVKKDMYSTMSTSLYL